ncbi:hypothetical protein TKK_0011684 [Trichogramma kaykai]
MSFLGSIGNIMDGSGLQEAFEIIFAQCSAAKALTGHAYSRAVRGHLLVQNAISNIILSSINISPENNFVINECLEALKDEFEHLHEFYEVSDLNEIKNFFWNELQLLRKNGPTAQLWVEYFEMVQLVKNFIEAERTGDYEKHLKCVRNMLPYFHASGHNLYAKSAHLYLQDMLSDDYKTNSGEFDKFS